MFILTCYIKFEKKQQQQHKGYSLTKYYTGFMNLFAIK